MSDWEYKVLRFDGFTDEEFSGFLNLHGKDGWELIAQDDGRAWVFKRPIQWNTRRPKEKTS